MKKTLKRVAIGAGVSFIIALSFFAGLYVDAQRTVIGNGIAAIYGGSSSTTDHKNIDTTTFWKVWDLLENKYISTSTTTEKISDEEKMYGAIKGLVDSIEDPYTTFFTPEEAEIFKSDLSGTLEGIGATLNNKDGVLTITSIIKDSPASKSGLQEGDKIIKVGDVDTADLTIDESIKLIRGKKGTKVTLTIIKNGKVKSESITIVRDTINTPIVETKIYPNSVFLIKLSSFTSNSASAFRNALREFVDSGSKKLIIDLRNNTGGYMDAAVDMASWFLPAGKVVVTEDFGKSKEPATYRSKGYNLFSSSMKIVILVNENSASASEILAGALKDYNKATLVGAKTYGKGSVQELVSVTDKAMLKITIAKWLTPKGVSISHNGLVPDYVVEMTEDDYKNKKDPQLDKALEVVSKQ